MSYTFGFNLGISNIGWAVYDTQNNALVKLGVHTFDPAEHPKDGKSLALPRREARGQRRRIRRRAYRMKSIRSYLINSGLITHGAMELLYKTPGQGIDQYNVYELRTRALDSLISNHDLVKILIHLAKHRGFKSNRKGEAKDKDSQKMKLAMRENHDLLAAYRSVGEMFYKQDKFSDRKRNFTGDYRCIVLRSDLEAEALRILETQAEFGNESITPAFIERYITMFNWQKPFDFNNNIIGMVGKCQFEPNELRAPKACYSAELFVALSKLNNIRYEVDSIEYKLSVNEIAQIITLATNRTTKKFNISYKTLRKTLQLEDNARFNFVRYDAHDDFLECEKELINELEFKAYHELKSAIINRGDIWNSLESNVDLLNQIGVILTYNKTDDTIQSALNTLLLKNEFNPSQTNTIISAILDNGVGFDKNLNLSLKVVQKLIPFLEQGKRYDQACELAGYEFKGQTQNKSNYLPSLKELGIDIDLTNPVAIRAITQFRKLVNALVREYGSPYQINMQMMRDIGKTRELRNKIHSEQKKRAVNNQQLFNEFIELFGSKPIKDELLRYRLWRQQGNKCLLSQKHISVEAVRHGNYLCQITHILPLSRSFDNSINNTILAYTSEVQNKRNQSVYEYLMFNEQKLNWLNEYSEYLLKHNKQFGYSYTKHRLLGLKKFNDEDYINRNLSDSSYIATYCYNYVRKHLKFAESRNKVPVRVITGQATGFLRNRWGLWKDKNANVLHNATDAAVVAVFSEKMKQKVTKYLQLEEQALGNSDDYVDQSTGEVFEYFPRPHINFKFEINDHLSKLFVSRMPRHKVAGKIHDDTIRSLKYVDNTRPDYYGGKPFSMVRKPLQESGIKLNEEGDILKIAPMYKHTRPELYNALKERLEQHDNDCKKAFAEPLYAPDQTGRPTNLLIKTIKTAQLQSAGVRVHKGTGIADNGGIVRSDVFTKNNKTYIVPIYQSEARKGLELPTTANGDIEIDESYKFMFSLFSDDLIKVTQGSDSYFAYFNSLNFKAGKILIEKHDKSSWDRKNVAKDGAAPITQRTLAINTISLEKYLIDILANKVKVRQETRLKFI
ncbi:MAG: type II CRISPR RNA-guided endonuclease Cas9 [Burkholderiales bacterium]|nr:type II CRISPR RNA-guided endonuclease Cas9 [Burkholderiales bacterium]